MGISGKEERRSGGKKGERGTRRPKGAWVGRKPGRGEQRKGGQ